MKEKEKRNKKKKKERKEENGRERLTVVLRGTKGEKENDRGRRGNKGKINRCRSKEEDELMIMSAGKRFNSSNNTKATDKITRQLR